MGQRGGRKGGGPIPLDPVDLLAGLAPDVVLEADPVPAELEPDADGPAVASVAEIGKLIRSGDDTVRRLIRTPELRPGGAGDRDDTIEVDRAGVLLPRTRERPGE